MTYYVSNLQTQLFVRDLFCVVWALIAFAVASLSTSSAVFANDAIDFNLQIRPILSRHCISCHGPDEGDRQADLRLDTFEGSTAYAIVPGDADGSDVIDRIISNDDDLRMPPPDHADALQPEEIKLLREWIDQGAQYAVHWSFVKPIKDQPPAVPPVGNQAPRVHNAIDNFVLAKAHEVGLRQNPLAPPKSLVRRLALGLTGLPPQAHDSEVQVLIDRYLDEPTPKRFEGLVDRLLATPAYGEHWASVWLDVARYADTCGYSGDEQRDIWPWRDWLIRSLQEGKSYRDLSVEMLAGDLLPNPTEDQKLATAFHRNTLSNNEGGTDDEEFRVIAVKDRLSTTLNAWMGLTVRCAECHSHKYDPISHTEYYQLYDFFNHTVDADHRDDRPKLEVRPVRNPATVAALNAQIDKLQSQLDDSKPVWTALRPVEMRSLNGTEFRLLDDDSILATGPLPGDEEYAFTFEIPAGTKVTALRLEAIPHIEHNGNVGRAPEGAFILSQIRLAQLTHPKRSETLAEVEKPNQSTDHTDADTENLDVAQESAAVPLAETILPFSKAANDFNQTKRHARTAIRPTVKSGGRQGWAVNHPLTGYKSHHEAVFELAEPLVAQSVTKFKVYLLHDPPWKRLCLGCMRISVCDVDASVDKYNKKELDPVRRKLNTVMALRDAPVRVPVIQERTNTRQTFVMQRGNFRSPGEKVEAKFPEAFAPQGDEFPLNRLGLAGWLFSNDNPLTARVAVNRYWSRLMGMGIVETEEDFGTQGTPPSHPKLLDYLAVEFRDGGWDVRQLLKKIVMSATWQQSASVTEKAFEIDPRNRMLSRGPRVRLSAEVVRDQALAVSGLLSDKRYGEPVYPPNPVKRVVNAFTGGHTWQESTGEDRYRRAIYTFLKRSAPHPLFETFDMASRDVCSMRRQSTNTPLQSFMTLNDITFIEAARALAETMVDPLLNNDDDSPVAKNQINQQIKAGLEAALYVPAESHQIQRLTQLYFQSAQKYQLNLSAAALLTGKSGKRVDTRKFNADQKERLVQTAAMTVVANVILNLDNFLNN